MSLFVFVLKHEKFKISEKRGGKSIILCS